MKQLDLPPIYSLCIVLMLANSNALTQTISWTQTNTGLTNLQVTDLAINIADHIFASTWYGDGIFRSTSNGDAWFPINSGLPNGGNGVFHLAINNSGVIFAGGRTSTAGIGVFRSTNNGNNWTQTGLSGDLAVGTLAINSNNHIFAGLNGPGGTTGIYRSTDNGNNWTQLNTIFYVTKLAINSSGHIFAGTYQDGLFRSTDNGDNFSQVHASLMQVFALAFNSSGHVFAGTIGGVFRSTNNGNNWTQINSGLTNLNVTSLLVNSNDHIFTGAYGGGGGVFRSTNNGNNWSQVNSGLTNTNVWPLALNSSGYLFAGTYGGGVYRTNQPTTSVRELSDLIPESFALEQNYPNPFNPSTRIVFNIPSREFVSLKVYDLLGKEVAQLVSDVLAPGTYQTEFVGTGLATGIYLYRLNAGLFTETKKLILLR